MRRCLPALFAALVAASLVLTAGCGGGEAGEGGSAAPDIAIDGAWEDWTPAVMRHDDSGDADGLDLGRLWVAGDDDYLFLRFGTGDTLNLQEGNRITLAIDTDADTSTGRRQGVLTGADLTWTFGERRGLLYKSASSAADTSGEPDTSGVADTLRHADLGFASLPTVTSSTFEVAMKRGATAGGTPLFPGDTLRLALSARGDRLPDTASVRYVFADTDRRPDPVRLREPAEDALRIVSHNTLFSSILETDVRPAYGRIHRALEPDVIGFQEVYDHGADTLRRAVTRMLGTEGDATWHAAKLGPDLVTLSRYPILETHAIPGYQSDDRNYQSGAFLLDTSDRLGAPLLFINAHPPCCNYADADPSRDEQRQQVVDGIAAFIRDVKQGEGPFDVPDGTPIVVTGDMNFVGSAQQPRTLRTGAIADTARFGPPAAPDWDGTDLLDTNPGQTATPLHTTWHDPESSFPPGRLDYTYVSDSVLEVDHAFVLDTAALPDSTRAAYDLESDDTATASDHLPVVVDVRAK